MDGYARDYFISTTPNGVGYPVLTGESGPIGPGAHESPKAAKERVTSVPCKYKLVTYFAFENRSGTSEVFWGQFYWLASLQGRPDTRWFPACFALANFSTVMLRLIACLMGESFTWRIESCGEILPEAEVSF